MTTEVVAEHVVPPVLESFNDELWQEASPHLYTRVDDLLSHDEFRDIVNEEYEMVWRKNGRPTQNGYPVFAVVELTQPIELWRAKHDERKHPRFTVCLMWQHFEQLREESSFVTYEVLDRALHHALMHLEVGEAGALRKRGEPVRVFPETVGRFGAFDGGIVQLQRQLEFHANASS